MQHQIFFLLTVLIECGQLFFSNKTSFSAFYGSMGLCSDTAAFLESSKYGGLFDRLSF